MERITVDMLNEITEEQRNKLRNMWEPEYGDMQVKIPPFGNELNPRVITEPVNKLNRLPLLSIGQMIDILSTNNQMTLDYVKGNWMICTDDKIIPLIKENNLCTALWQAVKSIL